MSIFQNAKELKQAGLSEEQIRAELRGTILSCGDFPTCSSVEDAIRFANKEIQSDSKTELYEFLIAVAKNSDH